MYILYNILNTTLYHKYHNNVSFLYVCGPHKGRLFRPCKADNLFRSRVFCDGFSAFTHSVLGQFSR